YQERDRRYDAHARQHEKRSLHETARRRLLLVPRPRRESLRARFGRTADDQVRLRRISAGRLFLQRRNFAQPPLRLYRRADAVRMTPGTFSVFLGRLPLPWLDTLALIWLGSAWLFYVWYADYRSTQQPALRRQTDLFVRDWIARMVERDNRML